MRNPDERAVTVSALLPRRAHAAGEVRRVSRFDSNAVCGSRCRGLMKDRVVIAALDGRAVGVRHHPRHSRSNRKEPKGADVTAEIDLKPPHQRTELIPERRQAPDRTAQLDADRLRWDSTARELPPHGS